MNSARRLRVLQWALDGRLQGALGGGWGALDGRLKGAYRGLYD
jgi:hypothetical protein